MTRSEQSNVGHVDSWTAVSVNVSCNKGHVSGFLAGCGEKASHSLRMSEWEKIGDIWCAIGGISFS